MLFLVVWTSVLIDIHAFCIIKKHLKMLFYFKYENTFFRSNPFLIIFLHFHFLLIMKSFWYFSNHRQLCKELFFVLNKISCIIKININYCVESNNYLSVLHLFGTLSDTEIPTPLIRQATAARPIKFNDVIMVKLGSYLSLFRVCLD